MVEKETNLFPFLVSFLTTWGWQALGKIPDPVTGKENKNLNQAKQIIALLEMLHNKTRGNLTPEETRLLESSIADLQLNYVGEINREKQPGSPSKPEPGSEGEKSAAKNLNGHPVSSEQTEKTAP